jgi:hypothetical protein
VHRRASIGLIRFISAINAVTDQMTGQVTKAVMKQAGARRNKYAGRLKSI